MQQRQGGSKGESQMQLPIISVATIVWEHAAKFPRVFANRKQFRHFENDVTGLIALDDKAWPT